MATLKKFGYFGDTPDFTVSEMEGRKRVASLLPADIYLRMIAKPSYYCKVEHRFHVLTCGGLAGLVVGREASKFPGTETPMDTNGEEPKDKATDGEA